MRTRTLADAERDYDDALSRGAEAVQIMDKKLRKQKDDFLRTLAAVVLASGGKVEVPRHVLDEAYDPVVTIMDTPETGGFAVIAHAKREGE